MKNDKSAGAVTYLNYLKRIKRFAVFSIADVNLFDHTSRRVAKNDLAQFSTQVIHPWKMFLPFHS